MRLALEDEGYEITEAGERRGGARELRRGRSCPNPFDLLIIDIMLPGHGRLRLLPGAPSARARSRSSWSRPAPTPTTSWRDSRPARTTTSPSPSSRRSSRPASGRCFAGRAGETGPVQLTFGDLEILPEAGVVRRGGEEVHLTRTEFLLLCELAAERRQGALPRAAPRAGLELRLLRRRPSGRRPRPPAAHQESSLIRRRATSSPCAASATSSPRKVTDAVARAAAAPTGPPERWMPGRRGGSAGPPAGSLASSCSCCRSSWWSSFVTSDFLVGDQINAATAKALAATTSLESSW